MEFKIILFSTAMEAGNHIAFCSLVTSLNEDPHDFYLNNKTVHLYI